MPGQTRGYCCRGRPCHAVLQWRAGQLPGQTRQPVGFDGHHHQLQWRAGQLPGQTPKATPKKPKPKPLQWRAGQLPGQTRRRSRWWAAGLVALQWRAGQLPGQTSTITKSLDHNLVASPRRAQACFNGGPGNCPAKRGRGRAGRQPGTCFNGGPGNCPAKPLADFVVSELRVRGSLRAVFEGEASKESSVSCQVAFRLVPQGVERSLGLERST